MLEPTKKNEGVISELESDILKYKHIFMQSNDAVMLLGEEGFLECNPATLSMFDCKTEADFLNKLPSELSPELQKNGQPSKSEADKYIQQAFMEGEAKFEWLHMKSSGELFEAEVLLSPVEIAGNKLLTATVRDISKVKKIQNQLQQAQKLEAVGTLAAGVAHDFNNILNSASGYLELLEDSCQTNMTQLGYLSKIDQALTSAAGLVKSLLGFSRYGQMEEKDIDIKSLISETIDLLSRTLGKRTEVLLEIANDISDVKGDQSQLMQVFINLCLNAHQAMTEGGKITISAKNVLLPIALEGKEQVSELSAGEYVQILVTDNGPGIDKKYLEKVFDPFFTTKSIGQGTGLGLSSSYGIIKSHGGELFLRFSSQEGSCFSIFLPAIKLQLNDALQSDRALSGGMLSKQTILVVDDEPMIRCLNKDVLEQEGAQVLLAEDGLQGREVYAAHYQQIDLVILDLMMPVMSGDQCLVELKKINSNVKVIICSGYAKDKTLAKVQSELNDNIIVTTKPIKPKELKEKIKGLLKGS